MNLTLREPWQIDYYIVILIPPEPAAYTLPVILSEYFILTGKVNLFLRTLKYSTKISPFKKIYVSLF